MIITLHGYDTDGVYTTSFEYRDVEGMGLPPFTTTIEPPTLVLHGTQPVFDVENNVWTLQQISTTP